MLGELGVEKAQNLDLLVALVGREQEQQQRLSRAACVTTDEQPAGALFFFFGWHWPVGRGGRFPLAVFYDRGGCAAKKNWWLVRGEAMKNNTAQEKAAGYHNVAEKRGAVGERSVILLRFDSDDVHSYCNRDEPMALFARGRER